MVGVMPLQIPEIRPGFGVNPAYGRIYKKSQIRPEFRPDLKSGAPLVRRRLWSLTPLTMTYAHIYMYMYTVYYDIMDTEFEIHTSRADKPNNMQIQNSIGLLVKYGWLAANNTV